MGRIPHGSDTPWAGYPMGRLVDKLRMMAKICLPEVRKCLPGVEMCLPEVEMMFAGSGDGLAGSGDVVAGSGNVGDVSRKLRVFWKTKIQAGGGSFWGVLGKSVGGKMEVFGGSLWIWVGH